VMPGRNSSSSGESGWAWAMNHETKTTVREGVYLTCGVVLRGAGYPSRGIPCGMAGQACLLRRMGAEGFFFLLDVCLMIVQTVMGWHWHLVS
jgi:hypothetical protein